MNTLAYFKIRVKPPIAIRENFKIPQRNREQKRSGIFCMEYNPNDWDVESYEVLGYEEADETNWKEDWIEVIEHDVDNNTLLFNIQNTTPDQSSLNGTHAYILFFPHINK